MKHVILFVAVTLTFVLMGQKGCDVCDDLDGDGYCQPEDCNDEVPGIHPDAIEITCNGIDENCSGVDDDDPDADGDGYDVCDADAPVGDENPADCNDAYETAYPGASEICDGLDNDCDRSVDEGFPVTTFFEDRDGDGYGTPGSTMEACAVPPGYADVATDCHDGNESMYPGADEAINDGLDSNCNGYSDWVVTLNSEGGRGFSGDGSQVVHAWMNRPTGLAIDTIGNLYIADTDNNRIRRVGITGVISTVAGTGEAGFVDGPGAQAKLNAPTGLAMIGDSLYIADTGNHSIRRYSTLDGSVITMAGDGMPGFTGDDGLAVDATLNAPMGIHVTTAGILFVADTGNHCIRALDPLSGPGAVPMIRRVAGTGIQGYAGDGGPAINAMLNFPSGLTADASGTTLFVSDTGNHIVRKIDRGTITRVAGTPEEADFGGDNGQAVYAQLDSPGDLCFNEATRAIFVADAGNHRIRMLSYQGDIFTVAGSGNIYDKIPEGENLDVDLYHPGGVSMTADGNLFIADTDHNWLRRLSF